MKTLEYYDEVNSEFVYEPGGIVPFEYTLKNIYDWEAKWKKPFFKGELTDEELTDFYLTMALIPTNEKFLSKEVRLQLNDYIKDEQTATTFTSHENGSGKSRFVKPKTHTAEELYAMMFAAGIPLEFENRNLTKLMIILRIISTQNEPPKKMSKQDILRQNADLNRQRRQQMKTKG